MTTAAAICALWASSAQAGVYTDDLSKCLVSQSSDADKVALMQWFFAAMALHPAVRTLAPMTAAQHDAYNKTGAELMQRLMLVDCRTQTVTAIKYEGATAIATSFAVLGQVAARGLMSDPTVTAGMQKMNDYMNKPQWDAMAKDAGIASPLGK
jgi:hypothetical protein